MHMTRLSTQVGAQFEPAYLQLYRTGELQCRVKQALAD
jgi:hypothetical protein